MSAVELVLAFVASVSAAVVFLRWPGRSLGVAGALVLWTVAPWASWAALCAVGVVVVGRRVAGVGEGRGLLDHPPWAAAVLGSVVTLVGHGLVSLMGLGLVAGSLWWMVRTRSFRASSGGLPAPVDGPAPGRGEPDAIGRDPWLVNVTECERCGGRLVARARSDGDPAQFVARATCEDCGVRLVGVLDNAGTGGSGQRRRRLVWFELPSSGAEAG